MRVSAWRWTLSRHVYFPREQCVFLMRTHTFSSLWNQETLVHVQALFTADHALFTLQWYMDPWVLFQLSEQPRERRCSHIGGPLSDLQASLWEMEMSRRKTETLWSPALYKLILEVILGIILSSWTSVFHVFCNKIVTESIKKFFYCNVPIVISVLWSLLK